MRVFERFLDVSHHPSPHAARALAPMECKRYARRTTMFKKRIRTRSRITAESKRAALEAGHPVPPDPTKSWWYITVDWTIKAGAVLVTGYFTYSGYKLTQSIDDRNKFEQRQSIVAATNLPLLQVLSQLQITVLQAMRQLSEWHRGYSDKDRIELIATRNKLHYLAELLVSAKETKPIPMTALNVVMMPNKEPGEIELPIKDAVYLTADLLSLRVLLQDMCAEDSRKDTYTTVRLTGNNLAFALPDGRDTTSERNKNSRSAWAIWFGNVVFPMGSFCAHEFERYVEHVSDGIVREMTRIVKDNPQLSEKYAAMQVESLRLNQDSFKPNAVPRWR